MGQTCCGNNLEDHELNYGKAQTAKGDNKNFDPEVQEKEAIVTIQRYFKGMVTRRIIKEQYGFEAKHTSLAQQNFFTSD
jgi:hypothetical protein